VNSTRTVQIDFELIHYKSIPKKRDVPMKYVCSVCRWSYNIAAPDFGIAPRAKWEDVSDNFHCPVCRAGKHEFSQDKWVAKLA